MHELSVAQSIVDLLDKYVALHNASRVQSVHIQIGEAHCIVVDSLTFCFEMITQDDPILGGTKLDIEIKSHRALCRNCQEEFPVVGLVVQCPLCHDWNARVISGTEFRVLSMEIDAAAPEPSSFHPVPAPVPAPASETASTEAIPVHTERKKMCQK